MTKSIFKKNVFKRPKKYTEFKFSGKLNFVFIIIEIDQYVHNAHLWQETWKHMFEKWENYTF